MTDVDDTNDERRRGALPEIVVSKIGRDTTRRVPPVPGPPVTGAGTGILRDGSPGSRPGRNVIRLISLIYLDIVCSSLFSDIGLFPHG